MLSANVSPAYFSRGEGGFRLPARIAAGKTLYGFGTASADLAADPRFSSVSRLKKPALVGLAALTALGSVAGLTGCDVIIPSYREARQVATRYEQIQVQDVQAKAEFLAQAFTSDNPRVQAWAIEQMAQLPGSHPQKVEWVVQGLGSSDNVVAQSAFKAAQTVLADNQMNTPDKITVLQAASQSESIDIQGWAITQIARQPGNLETKVDWILAGLRHPNDTLAKTAKEAAATVAADQAVDAEARDLFAQLLEQYPAPERRTRTILIPVFTGKTTVLIPSTQVYYVRGKYSQDYAKVEVQLKDLSSRVQTPLEK